jgi:hypothetical protein
VAQHPPTQFGLAYTPPPIFDHHTGAQFGHHQAQSQFNGHIEQRPNHHHTQVQVAPFNHGRRRNFDEFAQGEQLQLHRVHQPLHIPGRVFVPAMDTRGLSPEAAQALRQNVMELRQQNMDAERNRPLTFAQVRTESWKLYLLQRLAVAGAAIFVLSTAVFYGIYHGAARSGKYANKGRRQAYETVTLAIESSCNVAKRRIVNITPPFPIFRRIRANLRPPSPRRRNGTIPQPPMTSNRVRWEDELRARRQELPMAMHGVESTAIETSPDMMSGAIADPRVKGINPLYNPAHTLSSYGTTALDTCVQDRLISLDMEEDEDDFDSDMSDPEHPSIHHHTQTVRNRFVDFFPALSIKTYDARLVDYPTTLSELGPTDPNAIASSSLEATTSSSLEATTSSSSEAVTSGPADTLSSRAPNPDLSSSTHIASASSSNPAASAEMPGSYQLYPEETEIESVSSAQLDGVNADVASELEEPEDHLACDFEKESNESLLTDINQATKEILEDSSIISEESTPNTSAQSGTSVAIGWTTPVEAGSQELPVSVEPENISPGTREENITISMTTPPIQTESQQALPISETAPMRLQGEQNTLLPGSFSEIEEQQPSSLTSHAEIQELQPFSLTSNLLHVQNQSSTPLSSNTPIANSEQHSSPLSSVRSDITPPNTLWHILEQKRTSPVAPSQIRGQQGSLLASSTLTDGFEQEDSPLSSGQFLEEPSSRPITPSHIYLQQGSLLSASLLQTPDQQSSPLSSARSDISLPITPVHNRGQPISPLAPITPKQITKKSVIFFRSPNTGKPITKTRKYIIGEAINYPVSSSPAPSSALSTQSSMLEFSSPTTVREVEQFCVEADKPAVGDGNPAGSQMIGEDASTTELVNTAVTEGSSVGRADKSDTERDIVIAEDEAIATASGMVTPKPRKDTLKLGKPESLCRKSSPKRHSPPPLIRKSLRLQNQNAKISPTATAKLAEKLTVLEVSGVYDSTANRSKQRKAERKAEKARAKQAAIEAAKVAEATRRAKVETEERARREAEEAAEKARIAKEEAEEKARKDQEAAEEKARKDREAEEERLTKTTRRIPKNKVIEPLTLEWEGRVKAAMDTPDMQTVLVTLPSGTKLTRKDFGTLKVVPGRDPSHGWLNDEIILASLQQVVEYGLRVSGHRAGQTPKYHAFNTFFYKNLREKGAQSVKRWATRAKIGGRALEEVDRVFIPVHQGAHWTLLVVSPAARTIEYFDSMGGVADSYIRNAKLWLATEMGARFKETEWAVPTGTHGVGPRQTNGSDCGVFTCTTARMVALGVDPMAYGGEDMGVQRGRMAAELLNGGLFGDFDPKIEF